MGKSKGTRKVWDGLSPRALDEQPDPRLVARHEREVFPLLHKRDLFAGVENFLRMISSIKMAR